LRSSNISREFQSLLAPLHPPTSIDRAVKLCTAKTSQTKKRKLSPQHIQGQASDNNPDIPLHSVEDCEADLTFSAAALPPHTNPRPQYPPSIPTFDYTSSAASSPSAAYAGLSLESERGGDALEHRVSLAPSEQDNRASPIRIFSHRNIMGGAADLPQRSSSPLKRPASELEAEVPSSQRDDVDMIIVPSVESTVPAEGSVQSIQTREASIDMLQNEGPDKEAGESDNGVADSVVAETMETKSAEIGILVILYGVHAVY
jgi:ubiquitin carboxyl-terminal hydrolase 4/11/15